MSAQLSHPAIKTSLYKGRLAQNPLRCLTAFLLPAGHHCLHQKEKEGVIILSILHNTNWPMHQPKQQEHRETTRLQVPVLQTSEYVEEKGTMYQVELAEPDPRCPLRGFLLRWASISTGSQQFACLLPAGTNCQQDRGGYQNIYAPRSASH